MASLAQGDVLNATSSDEYEEYVYDQEEALSNLDLEEFIPVTIVYGLTLVLGIMGNCLILYTIGHFRRMRTITNVFLVSLASADLLLLVVCIPIKFAKLFSYTWTFGEFLCKFVYYIQNVSAICSVLTLTSMSLERYYAILHPMKAKYMCTISQARKVIFTIWIFSFLLALPIVFLQVLMPAESTQLNTVHYWCVIDWTNTVAWQVYEVYMLVLILVLPTFIMTFAYASISCEVFHVMRQRKSMTGSVQQEARNGKDTNSESYPMTNFGSSDESATHRMQRSKSNDESVTVKQVVKMLVAVVVLFILCWAPLLISNVMTAFQHFDPLNYGFLKPMRIIFHLLAYLNSCVNPVVYGFMSRNFRDSFASVICGCRDRKIPGRQMSFTHTRSTSVSMGRSFSVSAAEGKQLDSSNFNSERRAKGIV